MGLFKDARNARDQARQYANQAAPGTADPTRTATAPGVGAGMMGMGGDMSAQVAYAQLAQKLHQSGVEAPGVVHAIRPTGQTDMGGGQQVEFDVSIRPDGGEPYQTTISQSM